MPDQHEVVFDRLGVGGSDTAEDSLKDCTRLGFRYSLGLPKLRYFSPGAVMKK
jgi:hypothetical protein